MIAIKFVIAGCNHIGANLAKELARFLATYQSKRDREYDCSLILLDDGKVRKRELSYLPLLEEDVGFSRNGVLAGVLEESFPNVTFKGYDTSISGFKFGEKIGYGGQRYSYSSAELVYLINCESGKKGEDYRKLFEKVSEGVLVDAADAISGTGHISVVVHTKGIVAGEVTTTTKMPSKNVSKHLTGLWVSGQIFNLLVASITERKLCTEGVMLDSMQLYCRKGERGPGETAIGSRGKKEKKAIVCCVGTGGTGGAFIKEFARFLSGFHSFPVELVLIDGDHVEAENTERQPFGSRELMRNKASVLVELIKANYPLGEHVVRAVPEYILGTEDIRRAVGDRTGATIYLLGCVDNHRARQVMEQYFKETEDVIYIDSGNEYSTGEVVVGAKKGDRVLSNSRAYYYPEVLTDRGLTAAEQSCGVINESSPQHLGTNMFAGHIILNVLAKKFLYGQLDTGVIYFDTFLFFSRLQRFEAEEVAV